MRILSALLIICTFFASAAMAQQPDDVVWVQIEAQPNLPTAMKSARNYAGRLEDVNGFALGGGWYGVVLGPYRRADAQQVLRVYKSERVVPRDSFITSSDRLRSQFWPEGADLLQRGATPAAPDVIAANQPEAQAPEPTPPAPADETPAEARRSERALDRSEREALQVALKWAGFYTASIDGAFGRGTRSSMASWQEANGYEPTGVLTTLQRAALIAQYNAVLDGMDLRVVRDDKAGIEMQLPMGVVQFEAYDYPFARFNRSGEIDAQVLLISQEGGQDTLYGLFDIMQTLEIVPLDGERTRRASSFTLIGENTKMISHTEAKLVKGHVKGFTLVWPAGDEARRARVLAEMRASFTPIDGVLTPAQSRDAEQAIDLVAGLQIRRPRLSRSGFFVDAGGTVVTTLEAVQNCTRITLDDDTNATLAAADDALGLAVLKPQSALAPAGVANFSEAVPRLQSQVAVAGYSYGGVLGSATMSFGAVADLRGLRGEDTLTRMDLPALEGDAGGPVFDEAGGVLGMLLPPESGARQLPEEVRFAANSTVIRSVLDQNGIATQAHQSRAPMAPEDIGVRGRDMTVLVSCWD